MSSSARVPTAWLADLQVGSEVVILRRFSEPRARVVKLTKARIVVQVETENGSQYSFRRSNGRIFDRNVWSSEKIVPLDDPEYLDRLAEAERGMLRRRIASDLEAIVDLEVLRKIRELSRAARPTP